jgi:hypothetical protein
MGLNAGSEQFGIMVCHGRVDQYISWAEAGLKAVEPTPYHSVVGLNFAHLVEPAAEYLISVFRGASSQFPVKAAYFEMNGFDINPEQWYFSGFAYKTDGTIWKPEWLAEWDFSSDDAVELNGMESVQDAFAEHYVVREGMLKPLVIEIAESIASHLICAHYISLIAKAHERAKLEEEKMRGLHVIATAHDWDSFGETR